MRGKDGFTVVLTADDTLMASYPTLFDGMIAASQTTRTPTFLMKGLLAPPVGARNLRAVRAPLGLRRVEAALVRDGWPREEVAIVPPAALGEAVGPATRVIGVSSSDPAGLGMNSTTMAGILGGESWPSRAFQNLCGQLKSVRRGAPRAVMIAGGAGAWALAADEKLRTRLGVDCVLPGYCESRVGDVFRSLMEGKRPPAIIEGGPATAADVPALLGPTVMGAVEISRGCGLGCGFCAMGRAPMSHVPSGTILADVATNLRAGVRTLSLVTEDLFRYGAEGAGVRPEGLLELLEGIRRRNSSVHVGSDHANVTSVAGFSDGELREVFRQMAGPRGQRNSVWLNLGVETASGELLAANGGRGKMQPYSPNQWPGVCHEQVVRLSQAGFFPMVSLVLGLPGETDADVERTLRWVRKLNKVRLAVFPLFNAPLDASITPFGLRQMSPAHWRLFRESYRLNFKWIPRLLWLCQTPAGVPLWRRALLQAFGRGNIVLWKSLFALRAG